MIHSRSLGFTFIKTHKTAGTSVEKVLSAVCGPEDIVTEIRGDHTHLARNDRGLFVPIAPAELRHPSGAGRSFRRLARRQRYFNHMSAEQVIRRLGRAAWDESYTFCFERNPWDKVASLWGFLRRDGRTEDDFETFVLSGPSRSDWCLYTIDGRIVVDEVFRFEDLTGALARIADRIDVELPALPHEKASGSGRADYRSMYDDRLRARVEADFRNEIAQFGYEF